jgi:hypothetical protein
MWSFMFINYNNWEPNLFTSCPPRLIFFFKIINSVIIWSFLYFPRLFYHKIEGMTLCKPMLTKRRDYYWSKLLFGFCSFLTVVFPFHVVWLFYFWKISFFEYTFPYRLEIDLFCPFFRDKKRMFNEIDSQFC